MQTFLDRLRKSLTTKTLLMPLMFVGFLYPQMDGASWARTACWVAGAVIVGTAVTDQIENSEWRQQLREDAEAMSQKGERDAEEEEKKKSKKAAGSEGSTKKKQ